MSLSQKLASWKLQWNAGTQCGYRKRDDANLKEPSDRTIQALLDAGIISEVQGTTEHCSPGSYLLRKHHGKNWW